MIWWKKTHYHASKMVSDQHQWCCSHTMLPPPMMNMPQPYNFIKAWHNTMLLRYFQEKQWKVYPGSISAPWSKRTLNSTIYIYNEFESLSFFIVILSYLQKDKRTELWLCLLFDEIQKVTRKKNRLVFERLI